MGVWLISKGADFVMRDGKTKADPVKKITNGEPVYFERLHPAQFTNDVDVMVVQEPPRGGSAQDPVRGRGRPKKAEAAE